MSIEVKLLDFGFNQIEEVSDVDFQGITQLVKLILRNNLITNISENTFASSKNLLFLDLSYNRLERLQSHVFIGLGRLKVLILRGNVRLKQLESGIFSPLESIPRLDLRHLALEHLPPNLFAGASDLTYLNLSNNNIHTIEASSFNGLLHVTVLDLSANKIRDFSPQMFEGLERLKELRSDEYKFCCLKPDGVTDDNCFPEQDAFSSCEDLMRNDILRTFLWIFGITSFAGNAFVIFWRVYTRKAGKDHTNKFLVSNLACSDILMGIYLLSIAGVDAIYRGRYIWNADDWRNSALCQVLGMLAAVSSQGSVFILCIISVDRFICICFPFSEYKLNILRCKVLVMISWTLSFILSLAPVWLYDGRFYSQSGVCLALPLSPRSHMAGIDYSLVVFVYLNLLALFFISFCYAGIYITASQSGRAFGQKTRRSEMALARKLTLVILTDFACWFPIIIMGNIDKAIIHFIAIHCSNNHFDLLIISLVDCTLHTVHND